MAFVSVQFKYRNPSKKHTNLYGIVLAAYFVGNRLYLFIGQQRLTDECLLGDSL